MNIVAFKSYDVRGIYPTEINEEVAAAAAKAFAFYFSVDKLVIGRDARQSSPAIHKAVVDVLVAMGVDVYDIGLCTTPLLNYALAKKGFKSGIMITASHNAKQYNALKLIYDGIQISSPGFMDEVRQLAKEPRAIKPVRDTRGKVSDLQILDDYVSELVQKFVKVKGLKIVVDYANGMGSITAIPVFEKLKLNIIHLNDKIDCTFPKHEANPVDEKNLEELKQSVLSNKADLGIFFDGDADRAFFVDDTGRVLWPDIVTGMLVPHELKGRTDKRVYYDLRFSRVIEDVMKENKGKGIMMRVGNPFYKEKLKKDGGVFAAELSGHFMFQDHYCIDDGLYASLKLAKALLEEKKKLSKVSAPLLAYHASPEINIKVKDADLVLRRVRTAFPNGTSIDIDGVFISYPDWWFNLRKSNTEPVVKLRLEADTAQKLEQMKQKLLNLIG